jgi:hypothetical protein
MGTCRPHGHALSQPTWPRVRSVAVWPRISDARSRPAASLATAAFQRPFIVGQEHGRWSCCARVTESRPGSPPGRHGHLQFQSRLRVGGGRKMRPEAEHRDPLPGPGIPHSCRLEPDTPCGMEPRRAGHETVTTRTRRESVAFPLACSVPAQNHSVFAVSLATTAGASHLPTWARPFLHRPPPSGLQAFRPSSPSESSPSVL